MRSGHRLKLIYNEKITALHWAYLLTLPLCTGVSRIRALSPAWIASPARSPPNNKFVYFIQSPYLFTIDRLFPSIVKMFRINFYRVSLDFSFRNTKLIVVYVIERKTTPIRNVHLSEYYSDLSVSVSRYVDNDPLLAYGQRGRAHVN